MGLLQERHKWSFLDQHAEEISDRVFKFKGGRLIMHWENLNHKDRKNLGILPDDFIESIKKRFFHIKRYVIFISVDNFITVSNLDNPVKHLICYKLEDVINIKE